MTAQGRARLLIRKLQALADHGATAGESELARARIDELLAKHNLAQRGAILVTRPNLARAVRLAEARAGRPCEECGEALESQRSTRRFCSVGCRVAAWRFREAVTRRDEARSSRIVTHADPPRWWATMAEAVEGIEAMRRGAR